MGGVIARNDQYAGGGFVETMDDAGTQLAADAGKSAEMMQERVDQRARGRARSGVDGHACGFVHHDHVFILIEDFEREGFGRRGERRAREDFHFNRFTCGDAMRALRGSTMDADMASSDELLDARAAEVGQLVGEIDVEARACVGRSDSEVAR